ncbi:MAG: response regulator [Phycisphaerales bacterium]|nr:response regulator [Phycisphaerales bacterium]
MNKAVRVIVVNTDEEAAPELRALLLSIEGVKIVAEIDEPALVEQALNQFSADVLLLHLDPHPAVMMEAITPLITARKDQLAAIAMTEDRDAELVMRAMRAGMREFLWKPFPPEQLADLLRRIGSEAPSAGRRAGRLIPVVGCCGGVGVTMIATNLAAELAQLPDWAEGEKPRVAIVDLDFRFGQVAMFLDAQANYTIADLCDSPEHIERQMIDRVMVKHASGLHVLAHPADIEQAERISAAQCAGVLAALQEHYDFVVTDGPIRFDPTARAVFDMTDTYLLVLQLLVPPVRNADRLLNELRRGGYNLDHVRLVCNRFGREAAYLEPTDVEATLNRKIAWTLPDEWKTASTATNVGAPLLDCAPKSRLRQAYQQMAREIAGVVPEPGTGPSGEPQKKGLFSLFGS